MLCMFSNFRCVELEATVKQFGRADLKYQLERICEGMRRQMNMGETEVRLMRISDSIDHFDWNRRTEADIYRDVSDGELHKNLIRQLQEEEPNPDVVWLSFWLTTDGVQLYEKPQRSFWPVFLFVNQIRASKRYVATLFCKVLFA